MVPNISADSTIEECRNIFVQFGIPNIIVSYHGTQFKSEQFQRFLQMNGIIHKLGEPYHPATNGQAERFVQKFKNKLKAMDNSSSQLQKNLDQVLLAYRRTLHAATGKSSALVMFGRQIKQDLNCCYREIKTTVMLNAHKPRKC